MTLHEDRELQSAPRVFSLVGVLLSRPDIGGGWLSGRPDRADLFKEAFSSVVRLQSHTGWSEELVLEHLGCDTKTEEEISALTEDRLQSCIAYMSWVENLLIPLDVYLDKRLAVQGAARFFLAAGQDLERAEAAMGAGVFPALEFLRLGEVARAWETAFGFVEGGEGDRVRRLREENPFANLGSPHLSPSRLEMLHGEQAAQLLGRRVVDHMREHLEYCQVCAASQRRAESLFDDERLIGTSQ
jgi:hypothetical protein